MLPKNAGDYFDPFFLIRLMTIPIDIREERGVRYLHFGSEWVQGAMRIARPWDLELAYTREMMAGLLFHDDSWPKTALLIGLGAASLTRHIYKHCPQTKMDIVEIEPGVVAAARQYFLLPKEDARLRIHIGDGVAYMLQTPHLYDLILIDGFDEHARAGALDTLPFYQACRARLTDRGIMSTNLFGRSRGFARSVEWIATAFDDRSIAFPSCDSGNVIVHATHGHRVETTLSALREKAEALKLKTGLDLRPTLTRLEQAGSLPGGELRL